MMPKRRVRLPRRREGGKSGESGSAAGSTSAPRRAQQGIQMLLCNSSGFSISGSTFNAIQGDMVVHNTDYEEFLRRAVAELRRSLPAVVGYSSPNALVITDALGETLTLPWTLVPTLDALSGLLVKHFRGKIGEKRVSAGKYCLGWADGSNGGRAVKTYELKDVRESNARLIMSIILEQALAEELRNLCPKCGKTELGTYVDDGWHVCRRCNTRFMLPGKPVRRIATEGDIEDDIEDGDIVEEAAFRHVRKRQVELDELEEDPPIYRRPSFVPNRSNTRRARAFLVRERLKYVNEDAGLSRAEAIALCSNSDRYWSWRMRKQ
ncbi:hypothetical protein DFP72DRAFT_1069248 [Ephemerocybe angulata]|uniref:Ubiquitin-like domain-containing protein n=1 Tax=Ephemerocybe angulata TaxID=980116 RepID=A0A8H6HXL5_9AGAR|nr:hypothetical protein DFP72DRAFT_1069248 [Tulosesus angulatus]